jgi:hypothetical protein
MNEDDLRAAMRQRFQAMAQREWCRLTGCNHAHVNEFVRGLRAPPHDLLAALNLEVRYVRKRKAPATPFLAIADLTDGTFAIVAIDPTKRVGDGCAAIVQSLHPTRDEADTALESLTKDTSK